MTNSLKLGLKFIFLGLHTTWIAIVISLIQNYFAVLTIFMTGSLAFIAGLFAGIVSWLAEKIPLVRKVPRNFVVGTLSGLPTFLICYLYFQLFPQVVLTWEGTVSLAAGLAIFHGTARPFLEDN